MMIYFAIRCIKCGKFAAKQVKEHQHIHKLKHKCSYCNKSFKLKRKNEFGLMTIIKGPYSAKDINTKVGELNAKK